jgi:hypothetical protein
LREAEVSKNHIGMQTRKFAWLVAWVCLVSASPLAAQPDVVLNEILYDNIGDDHPDSLFTELFGPAGTNLNGWSLVGICSSSVIYYSVDLSGVIPASGYFVLSGVDWLNAGGPEGNDCAGVELRHGDDVKDRVCYGNCAPGHVCNGEGGTKAPDAYPAGGISYSIARCPDHEDTDDNGADWEIAFPTPGQSNQCPCESSYYTISQVQEDEADGTPTHQGEFVSISGIAIIANHILNPESTDFFLQDGGAGVNIFGNWDSPVIAFGDYLVVEGWVSHLGGLCQIRNTGEGFCIPTIQVGSQGNTLPPMIVNCYDIGVSGEGKEGTLVRLDYVTIVGGDPWPAEGHDADLTVADGSGLCTIHIDKDTDIDGSTEPYGPIMVVGIVGQQDSVSPFTGDYFVLPRSHLDITTYFAVDDQPVRAVQNLAIVGCHPNPFNASVAISFVVAHPTVVSLQVFDLLGRQVTKTTISAPSPGEHRWSWNGRNLTGETVGAGLYFVAIKAGSETAIGKLLFLK